MDGTKERDIYHDPRLRRVAWRDLVPVRRYEVVAELLLPVPWLAGSLVAAALARAAPGWYAVALALSFIFFLTGLRIVHNAFHYALGLGRRSTATVLWIMSAAMLGSMDAVRFNHLRHHRQAPGEEDVEGRSAEMPGWRALLFGPWFTVLLHATALRHGDARLRMRVAGQLALTAVTVWVAFGVLHGSVLRYHVLAMAAGHCLTAFFAVWTVHHHCDRTHYIARTLRNRIKNAVTFDMFRHIEHHLFPAVPTRHLRRLSVRLDDAAPELKEKIVF